MSWRSGSQLFRDIWPLLQDRVPDRTVRQEFLAGLLALFLDWDVDPENLADLNAEVRQALAALGALREGNSIEQDDVASCLRQFGDTDEKQRVTAAQAIASFVHQSPVPDQAATLALQGLIGLLRDSSLKVRRAAANSMLSLLADDFVLPNKARNGLNEAASDEDEVVRKRVAKALKYIGTSNKREAGQAKRST